MKPGPSKNFAPDEALELARNVFWRRGYDGTAISELESALGIGRKSLYDTFGSKRELYLKALEQYTDTVIQSICRGLESSRNGPAENLERVLNKLQQHHASSESHGCLLGVAMAQVDSQDHELTDLLRQYLARLEKAFERTIKSAQSEGSIRQGANAKDSARNLVALIQGLALIGRISASPAGPRSVIRAALDGLKP